MELEEFKTRWNQAEAAELHHLEVSKIIRQKSKQPVAALQYRFRRGLFILPAAAIVVISALTKRSDMLSIFFSRYFIVFCCFMYMYFIFGYIMTLKMSRMDIMVRTLLENNVALLEKSVRFRLVSVRVLLVLLFVLIEGLSWYSPQIRSSWIYQFDFPGRLITYIISCGAFYMLTGWMFQRKYLGEINKLKELIKEINN